MKRILGALLAFAMMGTAVLTLSTPSYAQNDAEWVRKTRFTIDKPFIIPGAMYTRHMTEIPAGTYILRLVREQGPIVGIELRDQYEQYRLAFVQGIPAGRPLYGNLDLVVQFDPPARDGAPAVLRKWFYPGYDLGYEFK